MSESFVSPEFDAAVEMATRKSNAEADWGLIMAVCDKINASDKNGSRDALRCIMRRMRSHAGSHVVMQCLELLGACVNNCGTKFHLEVCSRDFFYLAKSTLIKEVLRPSAAEEAVVLARFKSLIQDWVVAFHKDTALGYMRRLYIELKEAGVPFPDHEADRVGCAMSRSSSMGSAGSRQSKKVTFSLDGTKSSQAAYSQEDLDLNKAIEMSLKETAPSTALSTAGFDKSSSGASLYPTLQSAASASSAGKSSGQKRATSLKQPTRQVRALYDFQADEENELSFKAGELVNVYDDSEESWWRGTTLQGSGLFPASFVTSDLDATPEPAQPQAKSSDSSSSTGAKANTRAGPAAPEINEGKIALLLDMLHNANATVENEQEDATIKEMEDECTKMQPLITAQIDAIDKKRHELQELNQSFQAALAMYQQLMQEVTRASVQGPQAPAAARTVPSTAGTANAHTQPQAPTHASTYGSRTVGTVASVVAGPPNVYSTAPQSSHHSAAASAGVTQPAPVGVAAAPLAQQPVPGSSVASHRQQPTSVVSHSQSPHVAHHPAIQAGGAHILPHAPTVHPHPPAAGQMEPYAAAASHAAAAISRATDASHFPQQLQQAQQLQQPVYAQGQQQQPVYAQRHQQQQAPPTLQAGPATSTQVAAPVQYVHHGIVAPGGNVYPPHALPVGTTPYYQPHQ